MDASDISMLLNSKGDAQKRLFERANYIRKNKHKNNVFIRGVIEISNICRRSCKYCGMRCSNETLDRYLMSPEEIINTTAVIWQAGIRILFLQAGENEFTTKIVSKAIKDIKQKYDMDIILCLGNKSYKEYSVLRDVGADGYILKHETENELLHKKLRGYDLKERLRCLRDLLKLGFKVGGGNIVGLPGQSVQSIAKDIILAKNLGIHYVSASPFIPHESSPLERSAMASVDLVLNTIAVMQLFLNKPIPTISVLDILKDDGQLLGFSAGANVITVNFTPEKYKKLYSLYSSKRPDKTLDEIKNLILRAGLTIASSGYLN